MTPTDDERWMDEALAVAAEGLDAGELPIGAVVVADGRVVGRAHTQEAGQRRLLVHAELLALDEADRAPGWDRGRATLYTTLEPCLMCLGAAATTMVGRVVFALRSDADGAGDLAALWDEHRAEGMPHLRLPAVEPGVRTAESRALFERYVSSRRARSDPMTAWARSLIAPGTGRAPG